MLKYGYISEVDVSTGRCRVDFGEGDSVSPWMAMVVSRTKKQQNSVTFEIKEHVACMLSEGGRSGVVLGAIYDSDNQPSSDAGEGVCVVNFPNGNSVKYTEANNKIEVKATGGVEITGDLKVTGKIDATDVIKSTSDVQAGPLSTSLTTHTHTVAAVQPGTASITSTPPI